MRPLSDFARVMNSDRYQYTESDVFLKEGMHNQTAVFEMFFRKTEDGGFAVVSGILEVLELIRILNEATEEEKKKYLDVVIFEDELREHLINMKFTGNIYAMRDGELAYPNEPVIVVEAPLIEAKILETPILNTMNHQMAVASKASRVTRSAYPVPVASFGSRRAHGFDSSVLGNKAAYIGGCVTHSCLMTEYQFDLPSVGTMSHSFIQAFGVGKVAEEQAFDAFVKHRMNASINTLILLVDTYNTLKVGMGNAIKVFKKHGIDDSFKGSYGIRIDSGDLAYLSKKCRMMLDLEGFYKAKIFLTNSLDEDLIQSLKDQKASFDFLGVGDSIAVSRSNPCFGGVYKIVCMNEAPVLKISEDLIKISLPGKKELYRIYSQDEATGDLVCLKEDDKDRALMLEGKAFTLRDDKNPMKFTYFEEGSYTVKKLHHDFVLNGKITDESKILDDIKSSRQYYIDSLKDFSEEHKRLDNPHSYKVDPSGDLAKLKMRLIREVIDSING